MNIEPKSVSFQHPIMENHTESTPAPETKGMTQLFLPNDAFVDGSTSSADMGDSLYTATPRYNQSVFFDTRRLLPMEKAEKLEKKDDSSEDGDVTKVELSPGEEEVSSRSSALKSNATSSNGSATHGENDSTASVSHEESNGDGNAKQSFGRTSRDDKVNKDISQCHRQPPRLVQRRSGDRTGPRARDSKHGEVHSTRGHHRSRGRERGRTRSPQPHSSRENPQGKRRTRDRHDRRERKDLTAVRNRSPQVLLA